MGTKVGEMDVFIPFVLDGSGGWAEGGGAKGARPGGGGGAV